MSEIKTNYLSDNLGHKESFSRHELAEVIRKEFPGITDTNVNWKIHRLSKAGKISRSGRGLYTLSLKNNFVPVLTQSTEQLARYFRDKFPLLDYCIWDTYIMNNFLHHQAFSGRIILETEKEYYESVFNMMSGEFDNVFLNPGIKEFYRYVINKNDPIIIIPMISQSPRSIVSGFKTITIEKLLVDLLSDSAFMDIYQESELEKIYKRVFEQTNINMSRLFRYAGRRNLQRKLNKMLNYMKKNENIVLRKRD